MPTPRAHGGAALQHIPLATPAFKGLNTQESSSLLGPEWATRLNNAVIDDSNRVAARKGWQDQTTTAAGNAFVSGTEFRQHDGDVQLVCASDTVIYRSTDNGASWTDVTGTAAFTDGNWQWVNFADKLVGIQDGEQPIVYSGTTFSHISDSSNEPTGGAGVSFAGRLWIADTDGFTLKYCGLLDETDWSSADAGSLNLQNVWKGTDTIQAVVAHNGALVIFGRHNVIFVADSAGSALGIDPANAYVFDVVEGIGCVARDSVQGVDGDIWFLSDSGLVSLGRLIQEKSNPINNLSKNVHDELMMDFNDSSFDKSRLRSVYSPRNRFYLLSLPKESSSGLGDELGKTYIFDTRVRLEDGSVRCLGTWTGLVPTVLIDRNNRDLLSANISNTGELFKYAGQTDDGASYSFEYRSGWSDLGAPGILKILKRFSGVFFADFTTTVNFTWAWDFSNNFSTRTKTFASGGAGAEWGVAEWGIGEFSGGVGLREGKTVPDGTGEYIKWGIQSDIEGQQLSVQQLELFAKLGRLG